MLFPITKHDTLTNGKQTPVSLVLGSGGARGLAHVGVIRALHEHGSFEVQSISGSSIGSLIGGLYAAGQLDIYTKWARGLSRADVWGLLDFSFSGKGLFEGDRVMSKLADLVGEVLIEDLPIPFTAVATDLERRKEVWLNTGSLFDAIRASSAIPGMFTPMVLEGRVLVDGGLLSPLPIGPSLSRTTEMTIAVSLNGAVGSVVELREADTDPAPSGNLFKRWAQRAQDLWERDEDETHPYDALDTIARSFEAMQDRIARHQIATYPPDIMIEIPVDACGVLDFHRADELIELGYTTASDVLDSIEQ